MRDQAAPRTDPAELSMDVVILGHDEADARFGRRTAFFASAGFQVAPMAFTRQDHAGVKVVPDSISLGVTARRAYVRRLAALAGSVRVVWRHRAAFRRASWIYAINLDNTLLGIAARWLTGSRAGLAMELADVQPVMLRRDAAGSAVRAAERFAFRHTQLVVTTSPGFEREYLPEHGWAGNTVLMENTVFPAPVKDDLPNLPYGPPWRIGWFGVHRCQESWETLRALVDRMPGKVELVLAGYPTMVDNTRFMAEVRAAPATTFLGRYRYPDDLGRLYGQVHFNWCVDRSAEGGNSSWLLPNRLYEGGWFSVPALVEAGSQAGRWVEDHASGVILAPTRRLDDLVDLLLSMTPERWLALRDGVAANPLSTWTGEDQAAVLIAAMGPGGSKRGRKR